MSIYKECEVCKTKINKLQNIWNIFSGKLEILFGGYFFVKYGLLVILYLLAIILLARKLISVVLLLLCKLKRLENER